LQGYKTLVRYKKLQWDQLLPELENREIDDSVKIERPDWHFNSIERLKINPTPVSSPSEIIHVAMVAVYKETIEVVEQTITSITKSKYNLKKIILVIAYEERGGTQTEETVRTIMDKYGDKFLHAMAVKHPDDIPNEIIGKGGNITYAGRELKKYLEKQKLDPLKVVVTTLDADNHPHRWYFHILTYIYCLCEDPVHISFQPIPVYTNNIWDAPAPMRVIATGNTVWNIMLTLRPHILRNFSSHAQSMQTIIDTDFWSVRTIVEDGHQFWRTYFRYDGKHKVYPLYIPIYQDAVLSDRYIKTLKAQFVQLRRWTYGASDFAYIVNQSFFKPNKVPKRNILPKMARMLEGHVTWAVAPPLLLFAGFIPALVHPQSYAANVLPLIISRIQDVALIGVFASLFICFKTLPPKPKRYKARRNIFMIVQWALLPVLSLAYSSLAAFNSQTRLMFKRYIGKFDYTEKAIVTDDNKTVV
jgi:cellulose synthase/poly-beta-1,6-N-acetylglucosamine synthase-like glycosyltransferase